MTGLMRATVLPPRIEHIVAADYSQKHRGAAFDDLANPTHTAKSW